MVEVDVLAVDAVLAVLRVVIVVVVVIAVVVFVVNVNVDAAVVLIVNVKGSKRNKFLKLFVHYYATVWCLLIKSKEKSPLQLRLIK